MVKKSFIVHEPRLFSEFKLDLLNNLITVSILAQIPRSYARNPTPWLSQLKTNVKVRQAI